jgi:hypothetical protein
MKKGFLIAAALLLFISHRASGHNGIYLFSDGGLGNVLEIKYLGSNQLKENSTLIYEAGLGYNHDLYPCFGIGLELDYQHFFQRKFSTMDLSYNFHTRIMGVMLETQYHLRKYDFMLNLGIVRNSIMIAGKDTDLSTTQIHPAIKLGVAYNFLPQLAAIINFEHVFGSNFGRLKKSNFECNDTTLNEVLFGFRYYFS